ncbi:MAG: amidohydrolase family protein, partial [Eubacteriales bacterium]|nr:amidohydrolase family protein [Eubacteriales bacterium]
VTINAAYQYFEEDQKGSIAPGKVADFVILSDNPLKVKKEDLRSIKVCHTIKQDRIIYSRSDK